MATYLAVINWRTMPPTYPPTIRYYAGRSTPPSPYGLPDRNREILYGSAI